MSNKKVTILGGGISGLTVLHLIRTRTPDCDVNLYEAESRVGGTIGTDTLGGYSFDWGPNGFLDREPLTLRLCEELGLQSKLERANPNVSNRFILRGGRLRPVPMSPPKFLASDILSWKGKLRLAMEPFAAGRPDRLDESIYEFGKRRIGKEAADYLIQPMVSGVYGGMADRLSLKSCFPVMREMEDEYGSLFKALISKMRAAKRAGKKSGGPGGPGGWLTSFQGGLNGMVERFEELYSGHIRKGTTALRVLREEGCYKIEFGDGTSVLSEAVVLALPAYRAATITSQLSAKLYDSLREIPYAPISVICMGYDQSQVRRNLDGFGFLVPAKENRKILGSIWTSSIFSHRAPMGKVQFRTMVGGDGDHDTPMRPDAELVEIVKKELGSIVGAAGEPEIVKIYRWRFGIPQYRIGHSVMMENIESELKRLGNLYLVSNAYYGISLNDCVKSAWRAVESM